MTHLELIVSLLNYVLNSSFYKYEALIYVLYVWRGHNFINLGATTGHNPDSPGHFGGIAPRRRGDTLDLICISRCSLGIQYYLEDSNLKHAKLTLRIKLFYVLYNI